MEELLSIETVARYLGVSERTVYNRVRAGDLPALKVGRLWRVRAADVEAWLGRGRSNGRALLRQHATEITAACARHSVSRLDVFGSALREDFTSDSDIDFLVEFLPVPQSGFDHPYWAFAEELEAILGRRVDLVMVSAVTNPYLADELDASKVSVYAA
ncbi:MAG: helix-turn-helix domain-containing protein [Actinobacteria bacterium]|nr:helix-turn-helix domain-containing protein [Actinomycetota bacterium]